MNETIKDRLNKAIDEGDVILADQLTAGLVTDEIPAMPKGFAEKIQALAAEKNACAHVLVRRRRFRRKPVILAAALVLLLAFATAAYAAGLLFPSVNFQDRTAATVNAALESDEYKAASEYAAYLNRCHKNLENTVVDPMDYPIYADSEKVKELSRKYQLKYATQRTDLKSLDRVEAALKEQGIPNYLGNALAEAKAGKAFLGDGETAFTFNDGNFYLAYLLPGSSNATGDARVYTSYTPKGSFPWNGFCLAPGEGTDSLNQEQTFSYITKNGLEFTCIPVTPKENGGQITEYLCFSDIGDGYITVDLSRDTSKNNEKIYKDACREIDKKYEEKAKGLLGIGLEELQDRVVYQWNEEAWDKEPKLMEKSGLTSTDPREADKISAELEAKYSTATDKEKKLYREWDDALDACGDKYGKDEPVSRNDLKSVLEKFAIQ